jgi:hypothetical protein
LEQPEGTKRNLAQVQFANSSMNQLSNSLQIDSDEDEGKTMGIAELIVSKPPKKKRETTPTRTLLIRQGEKKTRNADFKVDPQNSKVAKDKGTGIFFHEESCGGEVTEAPCQPRPAKMLLLPPRYSTELAILHIIDKYDFPVSWLQSLLPGVFLYLYHQYVF